VKLVGYADKLSVTPGNDITFMVSCESDTYDVSVVRLINGDDRPEGPGYKAESVDSDVAGTYEGAFQPIVKGSYARIPGAGALCHGHELTIQLWILPTVPDRGIQTVFSAGGPGAQLALRLVEGRVEFVVGETRLRSDQSLAPRTWYFVAASFSSSGGHVHLDVRQAAGVVIEPAEHLTGPLIGPAPELDGDIFLAAEQLRDDTIANLFNGKIDTPSIFNRQLSGSELVAIEKDETTQVDANLVARWDFSQNISSSVVSDIVSDHHGELVNRPTRAVTGRNWKATHTSWVDVPEQYAAIHFHDDDLSDARWSPAFTWTVPEDLPSGVYAAHLIHGPDEDLIWFVVAPHLSRPTADIALVLPTFSYLAYANEQMAYEGTLKGQVADYPRLPEDAYIVDNGLVSLYDRHSDGSSVCYASWLRPLVNMRPKYTQHWLDNGAGSPHQFPADLYLVDWLVQQGYSFDVLTDVELHLDGVDRLASYRVVLTGTHAEYTSASMLDAYQAYLERGGRLLYLSGNGMFWVTELDPDTQAGVEIRRRANTPLWTWPVPPGEAHLSSTGELGSWWSNRGRDPQAWLGVGMNAEGAGPGRPYRRTESSNDPRVAFVFDGIGDDELIGDFPCLVNSWGAAGFEFDWSDPERRPAHALAVATADQLGPEYEVTSGIMYGGVAQHPPMQADLVFVEYPNNGAVFSFSSISWAACLSYDDYDNNVSRLTRNVLDGFLSDEVPWR